jgi:hypothetical protein
MASTREQIFHDGLNDLHNLILNHINFETEEAKKLAMIRVENLIERVEEAAGRVKSNEGEGLTLPQLNEDQLLLKRQIETTRSSLYVLEAKMVELEARCNKHILGLDGLCIICGANEND